MIEFGSKEHTQSSYENLKRECHGNTRTIYDFLNWLKQKGKLEHLKGMKGLTNFETQLINQLLTK